ncbi:Gfo/Idh/MocA family protein [Jejuia pallidilutea]|nr:Gfo/Idh/MocA family oxidoreductase [Jejuia pallidilutea]
MISPMSMVDAQNKKLNLGVDGLTHGHVVWVFKHKDTTTFNLVGIAEPNRELAEKMSKQFGFSMDIVYPTLEEMIANTKPEAVAAFNSTIEHLNTVQVCVPKGIHVMVEKPLAVNYKMAEKMANLAQKYNIHLITNYETTWYPSNQFVNQMLNEDKKIGKPRRIIVSDGHWGPKEINVGKEFLDWLVDPVKNGGGAIVDFGCYGANLITWLRNGKMPNYVYATASTFKPDVYTKIDDDATILLEYDDMVGVVQPSWNWPFSEKILRFMAKPVMLFRMTMPT